LSAPRLFVSYSWTSPQHAEWVLLLATELRESGVDVVLDKWDLKEGHDAHAFMESMVTDPSITKVLLICDRAYADKADGRSGGVGTEAQIISSEIYEKTTQDKFVAVVVEKDENGKPYVPAYYRSRIYIDLSDTSVHAQNFEQLLRWIFGKPLHQRPELGEMPAYLQGDGAVTLATSARFKRAIDAIQNERPHAVPATIDYLTTLAEQLEGFRIEPDADPFDDAVVASIEAFVPYRNEAVDLFLALGLYLDTSETRKAIHRFFEQLIPYLDKPADVTQWKEWDFDNFRFIVHELFLYAVAALVRYERFDAAAHLMATEYFVSDRHDYGHDPMVPFEAFRQYMRSLEARNERLGLRRLSVRADLLKDRCRGIALSFQDLMQADFILFMRDRLDRPDALWHWWPETLIFADRYSRPFEVFARSRSTRYFETMKVLLGIDSKEAVLAAVAAFDHTNLPRWQFESFSPAQLLGLEQLATKP
jgi:TIR domain